VKEYDFIFSLGASCAVSMALRDAGLQFASFPFDWIGSPGLLADVEMVESDFARWFEREDLKLWDVRHEEGAIQRVYKNMRTNFGFPHEFTNAFRFETGYEKTKEKYDRRIARFTKTLGSCRKALGIYLEVATRRRLPDDALSEARRRLAAKFPGLSLDLVYFCEDPSHRKPEIVSEKDGVTVVGAHYGKFLGGRPMHTVDRSEIVGFIRENYTVAGHDIAAEKARYEAEQKRLRKNHWGKGRVERWINRKLFKTYRRLQDYLIEQKLVPGDRPCWFEESDKAWPHGPVPEGC
jgi:hypothetical protein